MRRKLRHVAGAIESTDMPLVVAVGIMLAFGAVMVYGAGSFNRHAVGTPVGSYFLISKHLIMIGIGLFVAGLLMRLDYHIFRHPAVGWSLLVISYALVGATLLTRGDRSINRWINVMGFSVQPVEAAKIALVMFLANRVNADRNGRQPSGKGILIAIVCGVLPLLGLLVAQPNYSNAMVVAGITVTILIVSDLPRKWRLSTLVIPPALVLALLVSGKVQRRVGRVLEGFHEGNYCYQVKASLTGLGAGGWHGLGVGQSHNKFAFLPEAHTDFIYSLLGEEFGLLGTIPVIILLGIVLWRGYGIAARASEGYGRSVAAGLTTGLAIYGLANIAMVTGIFPVVGVPLPFISYGGTAMIGALAAVGVLLSIERSSRSYHQWRRRWERGGAR